MEDEFLSLACPYSTSSKPTFLFPLVKSIVSVHSIVAVQLLLVDEHMMFPFLNNLFSLVLQMASYAPNLDLLTN